MHENMPRTKQKDPKVSCFVSFFIKITIKEVVHHSFILYLYSFVTNTLPTIILNSKF